MSNFLRVVHQDMEIFFKNCYTTTLTLALTINDDGIPKNFEAVGKKLVESNKSIDAVELVPNGIIKYIYPLEGNEAALGLNIVTSERHRKETLKSIASQKMYFAGPIDLMQGGKGIVGRLPVYKNNSFWGFSAVVIRFENFVNFFNFYSKKNSKYVFQLSKINLDTSEEVFFLDGNTDFSDLNYITSSIPDGDWKIYLIDTSSWYEIYSLLISLSLFGGLLAVLFGFMTTSILRKPAKLELLVVDQAKKLVDSELKFKAFFDQAGVGMANVEKDTGKFIEINAKLCDLIGYSAAEIKNKSFMEITYPEDLEKDLNKLEELKKGLINKYSIEKRYIKKNGKLIWVKLTVSSLHKFNGEITSYISIIENISKRKLAESKSKEYQQKIESLINTIDGIVWECSAESLEFTFVSEKVKDILGYTSEEWLSTPYFWENHIHQDDKNNVLNFCSQKTNENADHEFEYRMIAKDGSVVWLRDMVNVISVNGKVEFLRGIMIDITKTKDIQNDLNNSFDLVTEQNKRLLNFSYIVSHNLRSHTSNISSLTDLINVSDSEEEVIELVQLLKNVSDALNETLENLNEVVNIQSNLGLVVEKIKLKDYIDNTIEVLADKIKEKAVKINLNIDDGIEIVYNPAYLESILYNLISNAIRYSDPNKQAEITISIVTEGNKKVLQIADNGIGIDLKRYGSKIFGMYKTFSNNPESKGIGLFITKNQIDAMGGKITIDSQPGVGTCFNIYIS
ncbi:PAS domain S-box protein [Flavobacterium sp. NG2]|uniref:PAS domain S-box protein n=1 Tax=Flavobacterium sp. NG2 TaxID=3097547 RepID=UPI002A840999|nr:PAS domain S-box protein [Flavobacterium sp. NG2]WPR70652.1 PAS domain S-box protein [Flavobacterium sp. NG2]